MNRSIAGYVQIELNLDEIYEGEQDLSNHYKRRRNAKKKDNEL